eukprot:CAMPEP_0175133208 /NCGR_PEP_ID=MMETSP0087-20121206/7513_1 /TAXON_ID=136419 /ORGANISM="Unknown Unknown, Strain D1" /LENGTH=1101 /DNA_ID=CAMNT_0016415669 /DNA_START=189 /DNA_END=3494 /DNA_ORIENTATION=-
MSKINTARELTRRSHDSLWTGKTFLEGYLNFSDNAKPISQRSDEAAQEKDRVQALALLSSAKAAATFKHSGQMALESKGPQKRRHRGGILATVTQAAQTERPSVTDFSSKDALQRLELELIKTHSGDSRRGSQTVRINRTHRNPPKERLVALTLQEVLLRWDKASRWARKNFLERFCRSFASATAPQLDLAFDNGASLVLMRIITWLRLTFAFRYCLSLQLHSVHIFLKAVSGSKFVAEFVEVGGLNVLLEIISSEKLEEAEKLVAVQVLSTLANVQRQYKELICEQQAPLLLSSFAEEAKEISTFTEIANLFRSLGQNNPRHLSVVQEQLECSFRSSVCHSVCKRSMAQVLNTILTEEAEGLTHKVAIDGHTIENVMQLFADQDSQVNFEAYRLLMLFCTSFNSLQLVVANVCNLMKRSTAYARAREKARRKPADSAVEARHIQMGYCCVKMMAILSTNFPPTVSTFVKRGFVFDLLQSISTPGHFALREICSETLTIFHNNDNSVPPLVDQVLGPSLYFSFLQQPQKLHELLYGETLNTVRQKLGLAKVHDKTVKANAERLRAMGMEKESERGDKPGAESEPSRESVSVAANSDAAQANASVSTLPNLTPSIVDTSMGSDTPVEKNNLKLQKEKELNFLKLGIMSIASDKRDLIQEPKDKSFKAVAAAAAIALGGGAAAAAAAAGTGGGGGAGAGGHGKQQMNGGSAIAPGFYQPFMQVSTKDQIDDERGEAATSTAASFFAQRAGLTQEAVQLPADEAQADYMQKKISDKLDSRTEIDSMLVSKEGNDRATAKDLETSEMIERGFLIKAKFSMRVAPPPTDQEIQEWKEQEAESMSRRAEGGGKHSLSEISQRFQFKFNKEAVTAIAAAKVGSREKVRGKLGEQAIQGVGIVADTLKEKEQVLQISRLSKLFGKDISAMNPAKYEARVDRRPVKVAQGKYNYQSMQFGSTVRPPDLNLLGDTGREKFLMLKKKEDAQQAKIEEERNQAAAAKAAAKKLLALKNRKTSVAASRKNSTVSRSRKASVATSRKMSIALGGTASRKTSVSYSRSSSGLGRKVSSRISNYSSSSNSDSEKSDSEKKPKRHGKASANRRASRAH